MRRKPLALAVAAATLALVSAGAVTATNTVASSAADDLSRPGPTANEVKPAACAALNLDVITGAGGGGGSSALVIGTPGNDRLNGAAGDDCIVGGAGDDNLKGNAGYDVCLGGPGNDTFHASCEEQYP